MAISSLVPVRKPGSSARRCLFGKPDHERVRKDLNAALSEMDRSTKATLKSRWGFDVDTDTGVVGGRYQYSEVGSTEYVPSFYTKSYTTRSMKVVDSDTSSDLGVSLLDFTDDVDVVPSVRVPSTTSSSTQTGQGLTSPAATGTVVSSVRRLDFKENCTQTSSTSTPSSQRSRSARHSSTLSSPMVQSTMTDHYQPRKRRLADLESSSFPRGKSPRL